MTKHLLNYGRGALLLGLVVLMAAASSGALQALLQPAESSRQTVSAAPLRMGGPATALIAPQTDGALEVAQAGDNDEDNDSGADNSDNDSDADNADNDSTTASLLSSGDNQDNDSDADNDGSGADNEFDPIGDMVIENISPGASPSSTTVAPAAAPAAAPLAAPSPTTITVPLPAADPAPVLPLDEDAVIENVS